MRSAIRSPRTLAVLGAGLVLLIAFFAWFLPYLTRERENVAGVPVPPPLIAQTPVQMVPGSEACLSEVAFDPEAELVELSALTAPRPRPPLQIVAEAPGYRETATAPGGYEPLTALYAPIDPPKRSVVGTLCIRNRGKRRIDLLGTTDPRTAVGRPVTSIDGEDIAGDITVRLLSTHPGSVLERLGQLVDRIAAFKPGLFGTPVFLWMVLLFTVIGVPAAALYSISSSFRNSD
jgi:hypothetical protein